MKKTAERFQYPVYQPKFVKQQQALNRIEAAGADFLVVIAFGHVLPPAILEIPKHGAINSHASLLPKYRGPAPIQWAVINGESPVSLQVPLALVFSCAVNVDTGVNNMVSFYVWLSYPV